MPTSLLVTPLTYPRLWQWAHSRLPTPPDCHHHPRRPLWSIHPTPWALSPLTSSPNTFPSTPFQPQLPMGRTSEIRNPHTCTHTSYSPNLLAHSSSYSHHISTYSSARPQIHSLLQFLPIYQPLLALCHSLPILLELRAPSLQSLSCSTPQHHHCLSNPNPGRVEQPFSLQIS